MSANKKQQTTTLIVAGTNGRGAKSTSVSFLTTDGVRPWAWIPNEMVSKQVTMLDANGKQAVDKSGKPVLKDQIRAGVTLEVTEVVALGNVQTTYTTDGIEYELQTPKQQLILGGDMSITQPQFTTVSKLTVV
jgi:hypothetical protein